jgi:hypothetical protein
VQILLKFVQPNIQAFPACFARAGPTGVLQSCQSGHQKKNESRTRQAVQKVVKN